MYRLLNGEFKFIQNIKLNENALIKLNAPEVLLKTVVVAPFHSGKQLIDDIFNDGYRLRYSGGMVPDLHQILLKGGDFSRIQELQINQKEIKTTLNQKLISFCSCL